MHPLAQGEPSLDSHLAIVYIFLCVRGRMKQGCVGKYLTMGSLGKKNKKREKP